MFDKLNDPIFFKKNKRIILVILISFFGFCAYLADHSKTKNPNTAHAEQSLEIDTYIPSGFVLIPIEIQNLNALDSIVGQFGVIDLYIPGSTAPLARGLKLIRSPKDPSQFAVLAQDRISSLIVKKSEKPFQVVVQNPNSIISEKKKSKNQPHIQWED